MPERHNRTRRHPDRRSAQGEGNDDRLRAPQEARPETGPPRAAAERPAGYAASLDPLPNGVEVATEPDGAFDLVHLFVRAKAEIDRLALVAIAATKPGGRLWISYPKRSAKVPTDVTRDAGWEAVASAGWLGVAQFSIDDVCSALRFRPEADIPRLTRARPATAPAEPATAEGEPT